MEMLKEVLNEVWLEEYVLPDAPKHHFSRRHRKSMKEIFCPQVSLAGDTKPRFGNGSTSLKKRLIIICVAIFLAAITFTAGANLVNGFYLKKHSNNAEIFNVYADNSPKTIETVYSLSEIPDGYRFLERTSDIHYVSTTYINENTNRCLTFDQYVKETYKTSLHSKNLDFEKLEINGYNALYHNSSYSDVTNGFLAWDNGDYILEIFGDFNKEELIYLAKSTKLL